MAITPTVEVGLTLGSLEEELLEVCKGYLVQVLEKRVYLGTLHVCLDVLNRFYYRLCYIGYNRNTKRYSQ